jgi:SAM-dependent methyltransferase
MTQFGTVSGPVSAETLPYNAAYYLGADGQPQNTFNFDAARTLSRAQAVLLSGGVATGELVIDYGCGLGAMTLAFNRLGCPAVGVEQSPWAVANALPEARRYVQALGDTGMTGFRDGSFGLAFSKDVLEHVPEDQIPGLCEELLRVADQAIFVIPTVGKDRRFIFGTYENDPTHVTRLTAPEWLGFLGSFASVEELPELTRRIRRPDKIEGTVSVLVS